MKTHSLVEKVFFAFVLFVYGDIRALCVDIFSAQRAR